MPPKGWQQENSCIGFSNISYLCMTHNQASSFKLSGHFKLMSGVLLFSGLSKCVNLKDENQLSNSCVEQWHHKTGTLVSILGSTFFFLIMLALSVCHQLFTHLLRKTHCYKMYIEGKIKLCTMYLHRYSFLRSLCQSVLGMYLQKLRDVN